MSERPAFDNRLLVPPKDKADAVLSDLVNREIGILHKKGVVEGFVLAYYPTIKTLAIAALNPQYSDGGGRTFDEINPKYFLHYTPQGFVLEGETDMGPASVHYSSEKQNGNVELIMKPIMPRS